MGSGEILEFDGKRLWAGIAFHLSDQRLPHWQKCKSISPDSLYRTRDRLALLKTTFKVTRNEWRSMTDVGRLLWLMETTKTTGHMIEGTETLELIKYVK